VHVGCCSHHVDLRIFVEVRYALMARVRLYADRRTQNFGLCQNTAEHGSLWISRQSPWSHPYACQGPHTLDRDYRCACTATNTLPVRPFCSMCAASSSPYIQVAPVFPNPPSKRLPTLEDTCTSTKHWQINIFTCVTSFVSENRDELSCVALFTPHWSQTPTLPAHVHV
jgi:hypothetical protein